MENIEQAVIDLIDMGFTSKDVKEFDSLRFTEEEKMQIVEAMKNK